MSARTKARKRAIDIIFQADVLHKPLAQVFAVEKARISGQANPLAHWDYSQEIVQGVIDNLALIDDYIAQSSQDWSLERMPNFDRAALRVATWEICFNAEIPAPVAIDEALELVKEYSTDNSGSFVNGVLANIAQTYAN